MNIRERSIGTTKKLLINQNRFPPNADYRFLHPARGGVFRAHKISVEVDKKINPTAAQALRHQGRFVLRSFGSAEQLQNPSIPLRPRAEWGFGDKIGLFTLKVFFDTIRTMNEKILIVEDDNFLSTILANRLKKEGFVVLQAFNGEEALDLLKTEKPNLIVLDLILPKKSGFDVLETISADPQLNQIPVVVFSNLGQESDIGKTKSLGAIEYHIKVRTSVNDFLGIIKDVMTRFPKST